MLTRVYHKHFKGLPDREVQLGQLTFLTGANGAGKTAITQALTLAVLGYVPGLAKKNPDIMAAFGNGEKCVVEVKQDGVRVSRGYFTQASGQISERFQIDLKKATKDQAILALKGVKIFDLAAFNALSDQKKIDLIFELFPPSEDYNLLAGKVEKEKQIKNSLQNKIEHLTGAGARLHQQRCAIELPAGTLSEINAEVARVEADLKEARRQLNYLEAEDRIRAEIEEKRKQLEAEWESGSLNETSPDDAKPATVGEALVHSFMGAYREENRSDAPPVQTKTADVFHFSLKEEMEMSLGSILATMQNTGCVACAATLVCKRELGKLRGAA